MDQHLLQAAKMGDTGALHSLLREEPDALDKVALLPGADTPLHVATLAGKTHFAKAVIELKPGFAWEMNRDGLTPLHLACALGHNDIVDALLEVGSSSLCLVRDNEGRVPLHYAAINGKARVIEELVSRCPETLKFVTARRETCLHLALVHRQVGALEKLLERVGDDVAMLDAENEHGYNVYELAEATGQLQVLLSLTRTRKSFFSRLKHILSSAMRFSVDPDLQQVVASLIATVTFQAAASPPPSVWKEGLKLDYRCLGTRNKADWDQSLSAFCPAVFYLLFMAFNSIGFLCSAMFIIVFKRGRLANVSMITSLVSFICSYVVLLFAMSPDKISAASIIALWFLFTVAMVLEALRTQRKRDPTISKGKPSAKPVKSNAVEA